MRSIFPLYRKNAHPSALPGKPLVLTCCCWLRQWQVFTSFDIRGSKVNSCNNSNKMNLQYSSENITTIPVHYLFENRHMMIAFCFHVMWLTRLKVRQIERLELSDQRRRQFFSCNMIMQSPSNLRTVEHIASVGCTVLSHHYIVQIWYFLISTWLGQRNTDCISNIFLATMPSQ